MTTPSKIAAKLLYTRDGTPGELRLGAMNIFQRTRREGEPPESELVVSGAIIAPYGVVIGTVASRHVLRVLDGSSLVPVNGVLVREHILVPGDEFLVGDTIYQYVEFPLPEGYRNNKVTLVKGPMSMLVRSAPVDPSGPCDYAPTAPRVDWLVDQFTATHAVLLRRDPATSEFLALDSYARHEREILISRDMLDEVCTRRLAAITSDVQIDERFFHARSLALRGILSAIYAPLIQDGAALGAVHIIRRVTEPDFTENDLTRIADLGPALAAALAVLPDCPD